MGEVDFEQQVAAEIVGILDVMLFYFLVVAV